MSRLIYVIYLYYTLVMGEVFMEEALNFSFAALPVDLRK